MEQFILINKNSKAQTWGIDLMIAAIIFSMGIIALFVYLQNYPGEAPENINALVYDGNIIADNLLSEGTPKDWNSSNVVIMGILSDNKINETKIERFYNISILNYEFTKTLFNTRFDYFFFLTDNISLSDGETRGIGKVGTDPASISAKNLVKITRFVSYKNKPQTFYLYIWEP
ncbi:hypothetical protein FJZ19_04970 [Candidatus Pacearchaeota archaeon]|nr:hypothetical protein [Candidatus Pacearchaeota archaeon]